MKTLVRTLLVWFVLLAVPFQGFAAAAMTCAHGMAPAGHGSSHSAGPAQGAKPPCHGDAAQAAAPSGAHEDGQDSGDQPQQKKCGNCAACSVGTAMAPASSTAPPASCPCNCCPPAAPARVAAADPDLPDRPPRSLLA